MPRRNDQARRNGAEETTHALRNDAIRRLRAFLQDDQPTDRMMKIAKIALGAWANLAKEEQTRNGALAVEAMLAREMFDKEGLRSYVIRAFGRDSALVEPLKVLANGSPAEVSGA